MTDKALPCLINGCEPQMGSEKKQTRAGRLSDDWSYCKWCGVMLHRNRMWGGMEWKITWARISGETSVEKGK